MDTLLKVDDLHIGFSTKEGIFSAVEENSFSVKRGEILGIVGESGCGKSITSLAIMGLLPKHAKIIKGEIVFGGKNIISLEKEERRKLRGKEMAMIFQEPMTSLNPVLRIGDQIIEGLILHTGISKKGAKEKALEMMTKVGLPRPNQIYDAYPHELSGGMRQRIMIAMALICKPKLLIADEPTTALDVTIQAQILRLMKRMNKEMETAMIFISHDIGVISKMCHRVIVMYAGHIFEKISAEKIIKNGIHPYTKGLMECIPTPEKRGKSLYAIPGRVPSLSERNKGCPFALRCPKAFKQCHNEKPNMKRVGEGHHVRCFLVQ
ncbi:ABC transporter ATP-binding protein [Crassaminicella profunda]|uniref:ABC transporter ATP-binding protein n=1 Tax=Crassaminicella profunda TaxID=1286698 RepID=UPI001CA77E7B|nr:ABC transporter ATP-binding protein [Crassaminicella profunda]QZY53728.1 ABC transporter ATP-binding protein [Crassaminicella profunda]